MSRAALNHNEDKVRERARQAEETFLQAVDEGRRSHAKGQLPLVGPDDSFNLNPMLLRNISTNPYFQKCYQNLKDWNALVDEIYYEVKHMEPFAPGASRGVRSPSTAFCLLVRLFTLRCTEKQMGLMLSHKDSPYIRCIGFLYLRYAVAPTRIWNFFEPYLYDTEPLQVCANTARPQATVGEYVRSLLSADRDYHGTLLPRLPVQIERDFVEKLRSAARIEERALSHLEHPSRMLQLHTVGAKVRALYGDEDNPVTWYDAVVDRVITHGDESGEALARPRFVVHFPEYGNTETVGLGEMDLPGVIDDWRGGGDVQVRGRENGAYHRKDRFGDNGSDRDWGRGGAYSRERYYDDRRRDRGRGRSWEYGTGGCRDRDHDDRRYDRDRDPDNDRDLNRDRGSGQGRRSRSRSRDRNEELDGKCDGSYATDLTSLKESVQAASSNHLRGVNAEDRGSRRYRGGLHDRAGGVEVPLGSGKNSTHPPAKTRESTAEERAVVQEKKRKLMARYG